MQQPTCLCPSHSPTRARVHNLSVKGISVVTFAGRRPLLETLNFAFVSTKAARGSAQGVRYGWLCSNKNFICKHGLDLACGHSLLTPDLSGIGNEEK